MNNQKVIIVGSSGHSKVIIDIFEVNYNTRLPVIACGGAGNFKHLAEAYLNTKVSGLAMASIYHFGDNNPIRARAYLKNNAVNIKEI